MVVTQHRRIKLGTKYDHLFPKPKGKNKTVKKHASLADTLRLIPNVVTKYRSQSSRVAPLLKGSNVEETCRNIWRFVYDHIRYERDADGIEQVRTPARTWADRTGDCDCYSVFISSILTNLGIAHKLRITKYEDGPFTHIYPIVPVSGLNGQNYITLEDRKSVV